MERRRGWLLGAFAYALIAAPALTAAAQEDDDDEDAPERSPTVERVPLCDTPVKLGATFIVHDQPNQSFAMLRAPKTEVSGIYRPGMYVEGFEVVAVEPRGVLLARNDEYCWLRLQPDPSRPDPTPPPRPSKKKKKKKK